MSTRIGSFGGIASLVASAGINGFTLQNATPNILSWTAPSDGQVHRVILIGEIHVTSAETGGAVSFNAAYPDGSTSFSATVVGAGAGAGFHGLTNSSFLVQPGQTVTVQQTTALTLGASVLFIEMWAS